MITCDTPLPANILTLKGDSFYTFLQCTFSPEIKEIARLQGFTSAFSLLHSNRHLLELIQLDSNDPNLIAIKQVAAFRLKNDTWVIKPGIQYDADLLMSALRRMDYKETVNRSDGAILVSSDVLTAFPWLKSLIVFCQNSKMARDQANLICLSSFIENLANNLVKSSNQNRYSTLVEEFAFALSMLGGRQAYEFIRINLPGSLPSITNLSDLYNESREHLIEGAFRFDAMGDHFKAMDVKYAFISEDCTGVVQSVSYDRQSNSFVGFCPPLETDGFPKASSFNFRSFNDLEVVFKTLPRSSLLNIHAIQPITRSGQHSSPFLLSAYGSDNKFDTYDLLSRWLKLFDESLGRGIRLVGFATDCDPRYLRTMRLVTNFFASLPNLDLRKRPHVFNVRTPKKWNWFYLDPTQLFVVFQVNRQALLSLRE